MYSVKKWLSSSIFSTYLTVFFLKSVIVSLQLLKMILFLGDCTLMLLHLVFKGFDSLHFHVISVHSPQCTLNSKIRKRQEKRTENKRSSSEEARETAGVEEEERQAVCAKCEKGHREEFQQFPHYKKKQR